MATKAELEVELARLRQELKESRHATPQKEAQSEPQAIVDENEDGSESFKSGDIEDMFQHLLDEIETLPIRKPVLTALGVFFVGYVLGRSGHRG